MSKISADLSGRFAIGGDLSVRRLGYGAMQLTGEGRWGEPPDPAEAIRTLKRLPEIDVDFIDTADSYGPEVSERLIREALHPYKNIVIATKAGLVRPGPSTWVPVGRPEYLRQQVKLSLRRLGVERIDLWQLHRIDPKVPQAEQFGVVRDMQKEGLIRHVGLSQVSVAEIKAAQAVFKVATVQNLYNLVDRSSEDVLDYCEAQGIGFIPWFPLASGSLAKSSALERISKQSGASPSQIALAWLLKRSPVMLPIPGTSKVKHLDENVAAAGVSLSDKDFAELDALGRKAANENV
ncbi:aldo/keto reductase [Hyphomicrobium sp. LHD-15]|uniref:aldo/keto reductase n=1 Tax=Hyphomicrobium sp. LHD-15 TaxID=3072142 RepID=UPI00280FFB12|nr:aldo/keto reductase [Hyphomicrobium sp. LHD-15]MDQ8700135.1 aldo/keto reductase [Hyphomicrobium sp. LHD-15]